MTPTPSTTPSTSASLSSATATASGVSGGVVSTIPPEPVYHLTPFAQTVHPSDPVASPVPPSPTEASPVSSDAGGATPELLARRKGTFPYRGGPKLDGTRGKARGKGRPLTQRDVDDATVLAAQGLSQAAIGRALDRGKAAVGEILRTPGFAARVTAMREHLREAALGTVVQVREALAERLAGAITDNDAKATDAYARAFNALERTAASASGENKPQPAQVAVQVNVNAEEADELVRAYRARVLAEGR